MAGQVQIVYDAETAPAVNELFKLAEAQKKVEEGGKKVAVSMGDISKANMRVGREGQQTSKSMIDGLRGTVGVAAGVVAAVGAIAEAWAKANDKMVQYRQKERDLALLQTVKGLPKIRRLVENKKYGYGVSDEAKFSLFAGLQSEMTQEDAIKSYKTVVEAGNIIPDSKAQEFGQTLGKIKSLRPEFNNRQALNTTLSIFQQLRGNIGNFDQKQVEKLLQIGLPFDKAVGTAISFGRTSQGSEALGAAVSAINRDKAFQMVDFGQTLSQNEIAERDFYKKTVSERAAEIFNPENADLRKKLLGEQFTSFEVGLKGSEASTGRLWSDVLENSASQEIRFLNENPETKKDIIDKRTEDIFNRHARESPYMEMVTPDSIEKFSFRTRAENEYESDNNAFLGKSINAKERGADLDRLREAMGPDKPIQVEVTNQPGASYNSHNE